MSRYLASCLSAPLIPHLVFPDSDLRPNLTRRLKCWMGCPSIRFAGVSNRSVYAASQATQKPPKPPTWSPSHLYEQHPRNLNRFRDRNGTQKCKIATTATFRYRRCS
ncbi:unnamed protein product [Scytosiphon promiscuus]